MRSNLTKSATMTRYGSNIIIYFFSYLAVTIVEVLVYAFQFSRNLPESSSNFISEFLLSQSGFIFILAGQLILCLLVLAVATEFLRWLLQVKTRFLMLFFVLSLSVSKNLAEIPQVFTSYIGLDVMNGALWTFYLLVVGLLVAGPAASYAGRNHLKLGRWFAGLIMVFLIGSLASRGPSLLDRAFTKQTRLSPDSILIVSIDSLRPDFVEFYVNKNPNSELARIYKSSVVFKKIITPTAKTHVSLTSFLTGTNPEKHGLRDNLYPGFLETDKLVAHSGLIPALRNRGYTTRFILDETKFASFASGQAFDEVTQPQFNFTNLLASEVFRFTLFWSYFSNDIGYLILPQPKMNFAYSYGYRPKEFLKSIYTQISRSKSKPAFILAHTCSLHYPGDSRNPYIQRYQSNPNSLVTRYPNYFQEAFLPDTFKFDELKNLAKGKFDMIMDEVVEPLLKDLRKRSNLDNIHLVLMSDHGETFWRPGFRYSRLQIPYHGQPAILDEDSQNLFMLIRSPMLKAEIIPQIQSLTDVTKYLSALVNKAAPAQLSTLIEPNPLRYGESAVINTGIFQSEFSFTRNILKNGYTLISGGMGLVPEQIPNIIMQKTRSIFTNQNHWSFFPTTFGYETVVCKPPDCWSPNGEDLLRLSDVVASFNSNTTNDQKNGLGFELRNSLTKSGDIDISTPNFSSDLVAQAQLIYASHRLNAFGDFTVAYDLWNKVAQGKDQPDDVRLTSIRFLDSICSNNRAIGTCSSFLNWKGGPEGSALVKRAFNPPKSRIRTQIDQARKEFNQILKSKDEGSLRRFIAENRKERLFYSSFYLRFWSSLLARSTPVETEISQIRKEFSSILTLSFYEVDADWIAFLRDYSDFFSVDLFSGESIKLMEAGRLPLRFVAYSLIPRLIGMQGNSCYNEQILPVLVSQPVSDSWAIEYYQIAMELKEKCR